MSTSDSFNNRVAHEPSFVKPSPGNLTGSFVRLQPSWDHQTWWNTQQTCCPIGIVQSGGRATQEISTLEKSFCSTSVTCHTGQEEKGCSRMRSLSQLHHQLGSPSSSRALKLESLKCFKEKAITCFCNPFLLHGGGWSYPMHSANLLCLVGAAFALIWKVS